MREYFNRNTAATFLLAFLAGTIVLIVAALADFVGTVVGASWAFQEGAAGIFDAKFVLLLIAALFVVLIFRLFVGRTADGAVMQFVLLVWGNSGFLAGALLAAGVLSYFQTGTASGLFAAAATLLIITLIAGIGFLLVLSAKESSWIIKVISAVGLLILVLQLIPAKTFV